MFLYAVVTVSYPLGHRNLHDTPSWVPCIADQWECQRPRVLPPLPLQRIREQGDTAFVISTQVKLMPNDSEPITIETRALHRPGDTVSINEPTNSRKHVHFVFYDAHRRTIRNDDVSAIQMLWAQRRSNLIPKTVIY
jgi:hypothetical protein